MSYINRFTGVACSVALASAVLTASLPIQAGNTGAFVGGMLTSRVLHNMSARTQAEQDQAYYAQQQSQPQQVQQVQQAPASSTQTTEQKLDELNKLAAGGYITPDEYKAKKQAIIDSM